MGKYHPHGDLAIYDALVRMAQEFSMRLPLIDKQGNFGSVDGDPPAAMRYTECRLAEPAMALIDQIDLDTVDFRPNYDGQDEEPVVLPARFPNLLVNGSGGIAVGMATNIPPHNLGEVIAACLAYIADPEISDEALMDIVPGPDFPTGGLILGHVGIKSAYLRGRGSIIMRGRAAIEEIRKDREAIIITEIPYQVNKATMVEKIAELVRDKRVEGISDLRDESDRQGMRVVIELKRDAMADVVLNQLYRYTPLQTSFGVQALALNAGKPETFTLKGFITAFVQFREEVITRKTKHLLGKARDRAHILVGLAIAVANIDEVIALIRGAPNPASAREALMAKSWPAGDMASLVALVADPRHNLSADGTMLLSEEQTRAILDLRLQRLTALGREEVGGELEKLRVEIEDHLEILRSRPRLFGIIRDDLTALSNQFATPRRTEIIAQDFEVEDEDLIQSEDMVITVTHGGYIKRVPLTAYRAQRRGGKGRAGMATREEDFVTRLFVANTHAAILFFSSTGMAYKLKAWRLPLGPPNARGKAMVNLLPLKEGEKITTVMPMPAEKESWSKLQVMFATAWGTVRRNELADFANVMANGKIAMKLDEERPDGKERGAEDGIVGVAICTETDDVLLATRKGKSIRFPVEDVRVFKGRASVGVRGIRLGDGDEVMGMSILRHVDVTPPEAKAYLKQAAAMRRATGESDVEAPALESDEEPVEETTLTAERYAQLGAYEQFVLAVTERGFGKRTSAFEYRVTGRGGQGIIAIDTSQRNGDVVALFPVEDTDQIMLVTDQGQMIRCPIDDVRIAGRSTQGVTIFRVGEGEEVVSVERIGEAGEGDGESEEPEA
jgi:DNA gyrase subunit A